MVQKHFAKPSLWNSFWSAIGLGGRMAVGALIVLIVGWFGLGALSALGLIVPWPHAVLWAAIGWSRAGEEASLSILPLIVFSVIQDIIFIAPIGTHALITFVAFGLGGVLFRYTEAQRSMEIQILIPVIVCFISFVLYWVVSSVVLGTLTRLTPVISSCFVTMGLYYFIEPVFNIKDPLA